MHQLILVGCANLDLGGVFFPSAPGHHTCSNTSSCVDLTKLDPCAWYRNHTQSELEVPGSQGNVVEV